MKPISERTLRIYREWANLDIEGGDERERQMGRVALRLIAEVRRLRAEVANAEYATSMRQFMGSDRD